jgi:hypothetical protein
MQQFLAWCAFLFNCLLDRKDTIRKICRSANVTSRRLLPPLHMKSHQINQITHLYQHSQAQVAQLQWQAHICSTNVLFRCTDQCLALLLALQIRQNPQQRMINRSTRHGTAIPTLALGNPLLPSHAESLRCEQQNTLCIKRCKTLPGNLGI